MRTIAAGCLVLSLFATQSSYAWGAFSRWTTSDRSASDSICHAIRSTGSTRTGLAYTFWINNTDGSFTQFAVAENVTGRTKGADLWLQVRNVRGMTMAGEKQGFNIVPGQFISLQFVTGIPTFAARCAVQ